ncbi:MAG TPA: hypothetical protein ENK57_21075 [Polyangiaceae bacterium]|nr:hypothetical protein [Polyangiaceae bacterium]
MSLTVDIERYARLRAAMEERESRDDVLEEAGLTVPQWIAIQRSWLGRLAKEAMRGRTTLASRYAAAFRAAAPRPPESEEPVARPPSPAPEPSVGKAPIAPVVPAPLAVQAPPPVAIHELPQSQAMTKSMPAYTPDKETPFAGQRAAPASVADEVAAEAAGMIGATADAMPALTDDQLAQAPVFVTSKAAPPPSSSIDTTAAVNALDIDLDALPFSDSKGDAPAPIAADVQRESQELVGETAFVSALTEEDLAGALPFTSPEQPPPSTSQLTLEQYTSLVVEINHRSHERAAILQRYGLDEGGFVELKTRWNRTFSEDPVQYGTFRSLYEQYTAWVTSQR